MPGADEATLCGGVHAVYRHNEGVEGWGALGGWDMIWLANLLSGTRHSFWQNRFDLEFIG